MQGASEQDKASDLGANIHSVSVDSVEDSSRDRLHVSVRDVKHDE